MQWFISNATLFEMWVCVLFEHSQQQRQHHVSIYDALMPKCATGTADADADGAALRMSVSLGRGVLGKEVVAKYEFEENHFILCLFPVHKTMSSMRNEL